MATTQSYVHRFIRGKGSTTLLLLHGTGGDENDMVSIGHAISSESSILSPRGDVLENGMPRFFRRIREGVFDLEDLKFRSGKLSEFVKQAAVTYNFDIGSVIAAGYSNGANMAASILLTGLLPFAGAVLFRPTVPFVPENLPNLEGVSVFVAAGELDQFVPRYETERLVTVLQRAGSKVMLNWYPGGHEIGGEEIGAAEEWFAAEFRN